MRKELVLVMCLILSGIVFPECAKAGDGKITVTILYDNNAFAPGTEGDWGFSCLVEGTEKTILFDAGTRPEVFFRNVKALDVDLSEVDLVAWVPRSALLRCEGG